MASPGQGSYPTAFRVEQTYLLSSSHVCRRLQRKQFAAQSLIAVFPVRLPSAMRIVSVRRGGPAPLRTVQHRVTVWTRKPSTRPYPIP